MGRIRLEQELGAALGSFQAGSWLPWDDGAEDFWEYLGWDALDIPTPEGVELFTVCSWSFPLILVFLGGNSPLGSQNFPKNFFWNWIQLVFNSGKSQILAVGMPDLDDFSWKWDIYPWCCGIPAFPRCFPRLCLLNPRKSLVTAPL